MTTANDIIAMNGPMSSHGDPQNATQLVARLSHDLANILLPLRAVADLPPAVREQPENIAQLLVAVDHAVAQLTRITEQLRSLGGNGSHQQTAPPCCGENLVLPKCRVLVVEDQEIVRRAIVYLLQEAGQSCAVADTARAATERLLSDSFDLVLLDRNLPDMKAEQLAVLIHDRRPNLPLVLITGDDVAGDDGVRWIGKEGHFLAMIAKPLTQTQLHWLLAEIAHLQKETSRDR